MPLISSCPSSQRRLALLSALAGGGSLLLWLAAAAWLLGLVGGLGPDPQAQARASADAAVGLGLGLGAALGVGLGLWLCYRASAELGRRAAGLAEQIEGMGAELRPVRIEGQDEVARLAGALNALAERAAHHAAQRPVSEERRVPALWPSPGDGLSRQTQLRTAVAAPSPGDAPTLVDGRRTGATPALGADFFIERLTGAHRAVGGADGDGAQAALAAADAMGTPGCWDWLLPMIASSWEELLGVYGVPVSYAGPSDEGVVRGGVAAFIGFSGPNLSGNFLICLPMSVAQMAHPIDPRLSQDPMEDMLDWAGELANQFLGRLKNRLLGVGMELAVGIPTRMMGSEVRNSAEPTDHRRLLRFNGPGSVMHLQVEVSRAPALPLADPAGAPLAQPLVEGEMLLL